MKTVTVSKLSVHGIVSQFLKDPMLIDIDPPSQRGLRWNVTKQRKLIKTIFELGRVPGTITLRIPEDPTEPKATTDGKQRLTSIRNYISGELKVKITDEDKVYKTYAELPNKLRNKFLKSTVVCEELEFVDDKEEEIYFESINTEGKRADKFDIWFSKKKNSKIVQYIINYATRNPWIPEEGYLANTKYLLDLVSFRFGDLDKDPGFFYKKSHTLNVNDVASFLAHAYTMREYIAVPNEVRGLSYVLQAIAYLTINPNVKYKRLTSLLS